MLGLCRTVCVPRPVTRSMFYSITKSGSGCSMSGALAQHKSVTPWRCARSTPSLAEKRGPARSFLTASAQQTPHQIAAQGVDLVDGAQFAVMVGDFFAIGGEQIKLGV